MNKKVHQISYEIKLNLPGNCNFLVFSSLDLTFCTLPEPNGGVPHTVIVGLSYKKRNTDEPRTLR